MQDAWLDVQWTSGLVPAGLQTLFHHHLAHDAVHLNIAGLRMLHPLINRISIFQIFLLIGRLPH